MSKYAKYVALPCIIILMALYLLGVNLINSIDRVEDIKTEASFSVPSETDIDAEAVMDKIDINSATKTEFMLIDGIGEKTAEKIIEKREALGGFSSIEQIKRVDGIGNKNFEDIKDQIIIK